MNVEIADQTGEEEAHSEPSGPTIEEQAQKMGWNPDHQGVDKLDAAEFIRRAPLFERIKKQSDSIKRLEKLVEGMANTYKGATEAQYKKGIKDAEDRMKTAEAEYDVAAFKQAQAEKAALETQQAATIAPAAEPQEVTDFCERNPWFEKSATMRTDALEYGDKFMKRNPDATIAERLEYIETKMKKDYPDAFAAPDEEDKPRKSAAAVEGAGHGGKVDPLAKLKNSMSSDEKRIMAMYTKNGNMTEKEYLESYSTVRER